MQAAPALPSPLFSGKGDWVMHLRVFLLAVLAIGAGPAVAQTATESGPVAVHPARVPPPSSSELANLPAPPPGPIESWLVPLPDAGKPPASASAPVSAPVWQSAPERPMARASADQPPPPSAGDKTIAVIGFAGVSPNLTDVNRVELDKVAKRIAEKRLRQIELRGFAPGGDLDSRKIALARALVVRAYLIDLGVKSRIEVGSFEGEGRHVEILAP
jgi:outer membrane protein OmpA-like peptidoglycan-associated protein